MLSSAFLFLALAAFLKNRKRQQFLFSFFGSVYCYACASRGNDKRVVHDAAGAARRSGLGSELKQLIALTKPALTKPVLRRWGKRSVEMLRMSLLRMALN